MHVIVITIAPGHAAAQLHYKTEGSAKAAQQQYRTARATAGAAYLFLRDDYSREFEMPLNAVLAFCLQELEESKTSEEAAGLVQTQANARLQIKWMGDPLFKKASVMAQLSAGGANPVMRQ